MHFRNLVLGTLLCTATNGLPWNNQDDNASEPEGKRYKHVALFSVDGFHSSDVARYTSLRPNSSIAGLLATGYEYTNAFTAAPSDSFPGTLNQYTGASPRTTGVWYDDIWDRSIYPPYSANKTRCEGKPGAEVALAENLDSDPTKLFSGGINPDELPQKSVNGKCQLIYPHNRLRVNTIFEVVHEAEKQTAYADKHPAYDLVRGPSGEGLTVGYFPEIAAVDNTVDATITYDELHVTAFLEWIKGTTPANSETQSEGLTGPPTLFGGNFQSVSVGQKTAGYTNDSRQTFTAPLLKAVDFVDASLGKIVDALKAQKIYNQTLIIVASKHGQTPINPALYRKIDQKLIISATGIEADWTTTDDIALIFLKDQSTLQKAVQALEANSAKLQIDDIIYGDRMVDMGFGNPKTDPAVPDIIIRPQLGVIYTTSTQKIAEHGGLSDDDRKVACFASAPGLKKRVIDETISTRQIAPTVLEVLGLDTGKLQGASAEGTRTLPGF